MKIPEEIMEQVINGSMQGLYNIFVTLEGEYTGYSKDYEKVRYGELIKFEIYDLWENSGIIAHKDKSGVVMVGDEEIALTDFRTEKENRRKIMAEAIVNNIKESPLVPRGKK